MKQGNKSDWVIALLQRRRSRPGCHLAEQTLSLCGTDRGFVEAELGGSVLFVWSGAPRAVSGKLTSHFTYASTCLGALQNTCAIRVTCHLALDRGADKTSGNNDTGMHAPRTHTHFFKTGQLLISRLLIPDILYQAFYLLFIHFHNDLRCYSERSLVNLEPLASILSSGCVLSAAVLGLMCALAPISQLYLVVMIS